MLSALADKARVRACCPDSSQGDEHNAFQLHNLLPREARSSARIWVDVHGRCDLREAARVNLSVIRGVDKVKTRRHGARARACAYVYACVRASVGRTS
eukprot:6159680-Pleurochrysis_carterae.AAC.2